jgi:hypothetical protein
MPPRIACAKKSCDAMGGNPHGLYQEAHEPLELSRQERSCPVSSMLLKGTGEVEATHQEARLGSETLW